MEKKLYTYNDGVAMFGRIVEPNFSAETYAVSPERARSNILYQFKKANGYTTSANLTLTGKVSVAHLNQ